MRAIVIAIVSAAAFAPLTAQDAKAKGPGDRQEAFLKGVLEGKVQEACDALAKGGPLTDMSEIVNSLERGVKLYGGAVEIENLGLVRQEKHVAMGLAILCCEKMPLYFYFVWYRPRETSDWRLVNTWFNDQSKEFWNARR